MYVIVNISFKESNTWVCVAKVNLFDFYIEIRVYIKSDDYRISHWPANKIMGISKNKYVISYPMFIYIHKVSTWDKLRLDKLWVHHNCTSLK